MGFVEGSAEPKFPPLLTGHKSTDPAGPFRQAQTGAGEQRLGAGDLIWSIDETQLRFAIVLEPEVDRQRCHEILFVLMVAFADAFGATAPPEVEMTYEWPNKFLANGAEVGSARLALANQEIDGIPQWMVIALSIRMAPRRGDPEPGHDRSRTTMWDEGCASISAVSLLEATARHFLAWVHGWEEDGFKGIHQTWSQRLAMGKRYECDYQGRRVAGEPLGLDEHGGLLVRQPDNTEILHLPAMMRPTQ